MDKFLAIKARLPQDVKDLLQPLDKLYASRPEVSVLCERVLEQLATGDYSL